MAETLSRFSIISFVIACASLLIAIVLWFYFKIPIVIRDLSGRNAGNFNIKKQDNNENTGKKFFRTRKRNGTGVKVAVAIPGVAAQETEATSAAKQSNSTQMLGTVVLSENKADILEESTTLLKDPNETVLLNEMPREPAKRVNHVELTILEEVLLVHTNEVIE